MFVPLAPAAKKLGMFVPLAPAAKKTLGVGFRRHCRVKACGGMLGAMARIAPARPATQHSTNTTF
jgi:hypothetical protein